jgi:chemotaxis signal transduction protein
MTPARAQFNAGLRRQTAKTVEAPAQPHLAFMVDGHPYACPITQVQHLMRLLDARTHDQEGEPAFGETGQTLSLAGADNIPIVSVRRLWDLPPVPEGSGDRQALLIVDVNHRRKAFLVDSCLCVLPRLPGTRRFQVPDVLRGKNGAALQTAAIWGKSLLVTVDLEKMLPASSAIPTMSSHSTPSL